MDRLTVMKSFVTVVDVGSFAGAARTLSMSPSLVSRHVADLEQQLGVQLLNRNARTLNLTAAGEHYLAVCEQVLQMIEDEDQAVRGLRDQEAGPLSVVAPRWIGGLDVGDAVAEFAVAHPSISVRFEIGGMLDSIFQLVGNRFDIAFLAAPIPDSSVMVRDVADLEFVICASPDYLERNGEPANPLELTRAGLLVNTHDRAWTIGDGDRLQHYKLTQIVFQANSYLSLSKAAVAGLGIALLPLRAAVDDIQAGRLRVLLPGHTVPRRPLHALFPPSRNTPRKVTLFLDFVEQWFLSHPMPTIESLRSHRIESEATTIPDQDSEPTASSLA